MGRALILSVPFLLFVVSISQATEMFLTSANQMAHIPCNDDLDCESFPNGVCRDSFCDCNGTRFCNDDNVETKVTKLGQTCRISADCNIEHSICKDRTCSCPNGRVGSENGRKCLRVADGLGSNCQESVQCYTKIPRSGCHHEKCMCQQKSHEFNGTCFNDTGIGEHCTIDGECKQIKFAKCIDHKCTCKDGYVTSEKYDKCLEIARNIGGPCYEDVQCSTKFGRAICKHSFCQCDELFQYKKQKDICVRDLLLGETCELHKDCHGIEEGESRLECILGECKCQSQYVEHLGFCASSANRQLYVSSVFALFFIILILRV